MRQPVLFLISFLFFALIVGFNVYSSYQHYGELVYPLDDAYIHMAISKNLEAHGVWGMTRFVFSSTSSSILYTLLLALSFALVGVHVWLPLLINAIAATILLWYASKIAARRVGGVAAVLICLAFVILVPIAGMAMLGMEHSLQILFCCAFAWQSFRQWNGEKVSFVLYGLTAFLAVATRYESAFLIALAGGVWLLVFKNWKMVLFLAVSAALPILFFGIYAVSQGGFFVPNSLLAKSNYVNGGLMGFVTEVSKKILFNSLLASLLLLPFGYWVIARLSKPFTSPANSRHWLWLLIGVTAIVHQVFASFGWMFRYEAYLIALVFTGLAASWNEWRVFFTEGNLLRKLVLGLFSLVFLLPILTRVQIPSFTNRAARDIHDQQLQMARFVQSAFPQAGIAMNDIGTTCFYNDDIRLFDMEGLGTIEILKVKKNFDSSFLSNYVRTHGIDIGIFYPHLYKGKIPSNWEQVGSWEIPERFVAAGNEVGFFVINPAVRERMVKALKDYRPKLPPAVKQKGIYLSQ